MVSVVQVYNAVKNIANKEQKGFITPAIFNSFAAIAQMSIYNEMFLELVDAKRISRQNFDPGRDKSVRKQKLEDLAFYKRRSTMEVTNDGFLFQKPDDLSKIISITVGAAVSEMTGSVAERINCELVYDPEKLDRIVNSLLSSPTANFPVALIGTNDIEIIPNDVSETVLNYYAKPTSFVSGGGISDQPPFYTVLNITSPGGEVVELPDISSCRDFMLPTHYLNEIISEILKLIGVRLRDGSVAAFATQEEASE